MFAGLDVQMTTEGAEMSAWTMALLHTDGRRPINLDLLSVVKVWQKPPRRQECIDFAMDYGYERHMVRRLDRVMILKMALL